MGEATTIRVTRSTLEMLEGLRDRTGARSLDQTIQLLIPSQRRDLLERAFGLDDGLISTFLEEDRGEDRR
ncbi:MAG: VapB-type antitoxin [Theionarchaea archaeon]|nr:VapB-type antitoxin [Theionarchaea archaeon]